MKRMRMLARAVALTALIALIATPAFAKIAPPVKVKLLGKPVAAEAGQAWKGQLEINVGAPMALTSFRLEGEGWSQARTDAPSITEMQKSDVMVVNVTATPADPDKPLTFIFDVDGQTFTKTLDLSARNAARALQAEASAEAPIDPADPGPWTQSKNPGPGPVALEPAAPADPNGDKTNTRYIRVRGRIVYYREDGRKVGADGCTVTACDDNDFTDAELARSTTDQNGYYDFTFLYNGCWNCGENPDLYVRYTAENDRVRVEDGTWENAYSWDTRTFYNFSGTDANFAEVNPYPNAQHPALHILTNLTRTWRYLYANRGYDTAAVDVQWPDGGNAYYVSFFGEIHIGEPRQWHESTFTHEYGHHWMAKYSWDNIPGYCNGICDPNSPFECGHCAWCPEDQGIAWSEGFPQWLAYFVVDTFEADYGLKPLHTVTWHTTTKCDQTAADPYLPNPLLTEGSVAALLQDISDADFDEDPEYPGHRDALAVGDGPIFLCTDYDTPNGAMDFLLKFKYRYAGWAEQIWQTAKNNGYEIDMAPPEPVLGLVSTSHAVGATSPDPTIDFTWQHPADDASGVAGYAVLITTTGTALPPATQNFGDVTTYTTGILAPGTYWINLRAVDRAGRWAIVQSTAGPYTVRAAEPSNLAYKTLTGWSSVLVPRPTADATASNVPLPTTLAGDAATTLWNCSFQNTGDVATSTTFYVHAWLDGKYAYPWGIGVPLAGHAGLYGTNLGLTTIRAGRHIFEARLDGSDLIPELNENDNRWGRQWSWTPPRMAATTAYTRVAPPERQGGWASVAEGYYNNNCDGVRYNSSGWWNAVAIVPANNTDDYDLYGHAATASALDGFTAFDGGGSARVAGFLDAVITNRNVLGAQDWDVGVINYSDGAGNYAITQHTSNPITFDGAPVTVTMAAGEMVRLWEFYVLPGQVGPVTLAATTADPEQPVFVGWLNSTFTAGGITNASATFRTNVDDGKARLNVTIPDYGYHALMVFRDPRDGTGAVTVTVEVGRSKPDLTPVTLSGWAAPLVPRPAADGNVWTVAAPDTLVGESASTYVNFIVTNQGGVEAVPQTVSVDLDGLSTWTYIYGAIPSGSNAIHNDPAAHTVRGGRHTLVLRADSGAVAAEADETNNAWGVQYAWSPPTLTWFEPRGRTAPPDRTGGWDDVDGTLPLYYNSDGLRLQPRSGRFRGVVVMPTPESDVDLRLHAAMTDPVSAFGAPLAMSGWGPDACDFVLVNSTVAGNVNFDVGVLRDTGTADYTAEAVYGSPITTNESGTYGTYTFAANHLLDLRAIYLEPGLWTIHLASFETNIDWGLSLYAPDVAYMGKSNVVGDALSFLAGDGMDESFSVHTTVAGWYGIAVWKAKYADIPKTGAYRLYVSCAASSVPDELPIVPTLSALVGVSPNPFNPQTTVTFDLAVASRAVLSVYDLRGALVRRLVDETLTPGRHTATWDGCDQSGQSVASGVYVTRFEAGTARDMKRMVLIR